MPYYVLMKFKNKNDGDSFVQAYLVLLKLLGRSGLGIKEGETLRNYAKKVDMYFKNDEMSRLTNLYERVIYRNERPGPDWSGLKETWECLVKQSGKKFPLNRK